MKTQLDIRILIYTVKLTTTFDININIKSLYRLQTEFDILQTTVNYKVNSKCLVLCILTYE